jgi:hypothetical protein
MCMFCAAMPIVVGATAVAQDKQRKNIQQAELQSVFEAPRARRAFSPRRISQVGALAFVGLLIASAFYHTHLPG